MPICKKCSKPYFHETNYENLCCKCYDKQNEKIYHCYPELTIIKIIVYAYDKFGIDELKRFNKFSATSFIFVFNKIIDESTIITNVVEIDTITETIKDLINILFFIKNTPEYLIKRYSGVCLFRTIYLLFAF